MSNEIRYFEDGEQATASVLNRPTQDLSLKEQYMSKVQFEALAETRRKQYAGSGFISSVGKVAQQSTNDEDLWCYKYSDAISNGQLMLGLNSFVKTNINGTLLTLSNIHASDNTNRLRLPKAPSLNGVENNSTSLSKDYKKGDIVKLTDSYFVGNIARPLNEYPEQGGWITDGDKITRTSGETNSNTYMGYYLIKGKKYSYSYTVDKTSGANGTSTFSDITNDGTNNPTYVLGSTGATNEIITREGTFTASYTGYFNLTFYGLNDFRGSIYDFSLIQLEDIYVMFTKDMVSGESLINSNSKLVETNSISRQDLVFLETWHEDVSEKDIVYPLGNIQYRAGNRDGLSGITEGTFSGADTYSLFGNWQETGNLIGKGYKWSTLSNEDKLKFSGNKDNNIYKDGDKIIQVRYRIRVIQGLGNDWNQVTKEENLSTWTGFMGYGSTNASSVRNNQVKPQGRFIEVDDLEGTAGGVFGFYSGTEANKDNGIFQAQHYSSGWKADSNTSYDSKCFAIPIALVQRRNDGAFDPTHNIQGSGTFGDDKLWYETSDSHNNLIDCFNNKANGSIESTKSGRPDRLYYDEINERDVQDLRMSAIRKPFEEIMTEAHNDISIGNFRGQEKIVNTKAVKGFYYVSGGWYFNASLNLYGFNNEKDHIWSSLGKRVLVHDQNGKRIHLWKYSSVLHVLAATALDGQIINKDTVIIDFPYHDIETKFTQNNNIIHCDIIGDPRNLNKRSNYITTGSSQTVTLKEQDYVFNEVEGNSTGGVGYYRYIGVGEEIDLNEVDFTTSSWVSLGSDGSIGGYPEEWFNNGIFGKPLITDDENNSMFIPSLNHASGHGAYLIKLGRKTINESSYRSKKLKVLCTLNDGTSFDIPYVINGTAVVNEGTSVGIYMADGTAFSNRIYINPFGDGTYDRQEEIAYFQVFYDTPSDYTKVDGGDILLCNTDVRISADATAGNNAQDYISNFLINKVTTTKSDNAFGLKFTNLGLLKGKLDNTYGHGEHETYNGKMNSTHTDNTSSPMVKRFAYLTKHNNVASLNIIFKEMKWSVDDSLWGDDDKLQIRTGVSTMVDDNGQTILYGQKSIKLPYFIED